MREKVWAAFPGFKSISELERSNLPQRVSNPVKARWWRLWTVAFPLLAGAALALALRHREAEPVWHGRSLSSWVDDLARGSSKEVREPAEEAVRSIGSKALPRLVRMLRSRDTLWDRALLALNRKQKRVHFSVLPGRERRVQAALAFEALGPIARPAIPELKEMLVHDRQPQFIADALAAVGPESVSVLLEALSEVAPANRSALYAAAAKWPSRQEEIIDALLRSTKSANEEGRRSAAEYLGRFPRNSGPSVTALVSALDDPEFEVRKQALSSLVEFGTNATPAIEPLQKLLLQPHGFPLESISNALIRIQSPRSDSG